MLIRNSQRTIICVKSSNAGGSSSETSRFFFIMLNALRNFRGMIFSERKTYFCVKNEKKNLVTLTLK